MPLNIETSSLFFNAHQDFGCALQSLQNETDYKHALAAGLELLTDAIRSGFQNLEQELDAIRMRLDHQGQTLITRR